MSGVTLITSRQSDGSFIDAERNDSIRGKHSMGRDNELSRILTWTGLLALLSVPIVLLLRRRPASDPHQPYSEDGNIFESELEG